METEAPGMAREQWSWSPTEDKAQVEWMLKWQRAGDDEVAAELNLSGLCHRGGCQGGTQRTLSLI